MADSSRDVDINIKLKTDGAKFTPPDISAATKQVKDYQKNIEEIGIKAKEAQLKVTEANLRAGDSFKLAGEGAFTMARGIVAIGVADKDMQKIIQSMAKIQGAFDLFKGSFDLLKGIIQGMHALGVAADAAAVSSTALAAANTLEASSATAAAAANATLAASMGPIGLALAGITFAVGAASAAWIAFSGSVNDNDLKPAIEQTTDLNNRLSRLTSAYADIAGYVNSIQAQMAEDDTELLRLKKDRQAELRGQEPGLSKNLSSNQRYMSIQEKMKAQAEERVANPITWYETMFAGKTRIGGKDYIERDGELKPYDLYADKEKSAEDLKIADEEIAKSKQAQLDSSAKLAANTEEDAKIQVEIVKLQNDRIKRLEQEKAAAEKDGGTGDITGRGSSGEDVARLQDMINALSAERDVEKQLLDQLILEAREAKEEKERLKSELGANR